MSRLIDVGPEPDERPPVLAVVRLYIIAAKTGIYALVCAGALFLTAAFSHQGMFSAAALTALSVSTACNAVIAVCRAYSLWRYGAWRGLYGQRLSREQYPARFFAWLSMHLVMGVIFAVASGSLAWTVFTHRF